MAVRKYRSVADMPAPPPGIRLDPDNLRRAFDLMDLCARLFPMRGQPGIRKFRTLEAASADRDALESALIAERSRTSSGRQK